MDDKKRTAIIAFVHSLLPVLVLAGLIHLDADGMALVMLAVNNGLTVFAFFIKTGQQPDKASAERIAELEAEITRLQARLQEGRQFLPPMPL